MTTIIFNGKRYETIKHVCEDLGIHYMAVYRRVKKGMSLEAAICEAISLKPKSTPVVVGGVQYGSIKEACEKYDIGYHTVYYRVKKGMSLEDAISLADGRKFDHTGKQVVVNSEKFPSIAAACKSFGIRYNTFYKRLKKGMSIEEALNKSIKKRG